MAVYICMYVCVFLYFHAPPVNAFPAAPIQHFSSAVFCLLSTFFAFVSMVYNTDLRIYIYLYLYICIWYLVDLQPFVMFGGAVWCRMVARASMTYSSALHVCIRVYSCHVQLAADSGTVGASRFLQAHKFRKHKISAAGHYTVGD